MIEVMSESAGTVLGVRASGKLTASDYETVWIPRIEAVIREHGHGPGQLQRRGLDITLTDARNDGFTGEPPRLPLFPLPLLTGKQAGLFPDEVDSGPFAESEFFHVLLQSVDADTVGQVVEKDIAGLGDG